jgi:predicted nucleic acid-binding protein
MAYVDTSALVPMIVEETGTSRVLEWLAAQSHAATAISSWTRTELVSAVVGKVRTSVLSAAAAATALGCARREILPKLRLVPLETDDLDQAELLLERFELGLRAGHALHLAVARRLGEPLLTLDRRLAAAAETVGLEVIPVWGGPRPQSSTTR